MFYIMILMLLLGAASGTVSTQTTLYSEGGNSVSVNGYYEVNDKYNIDIDAVLAESGSAIDMSRDGSTEGLISEKYNDLTFTSVSNAEDAKGSAAVTTTPSGVFGDIKMHSMSVFDSDDFAMKDVSQGVSFLTTSGESYVGLTSSYPRTPYSLEKNPQNVPRHFDRSSNMSDNSFVVEYLGQAPNGMTMSEFVDANVISEQLMLWDIYTSNGRRGGALYPFDGATYWQGADTRLWFRDGQGQDYPLFDGEPLYGYIDPTEIGYLDGLNAVGTVSMEDPTLLGYCRYAWTQSDSHILEYDIGVTNSADFNFDPDDSNLVYWMLDHERGHALGFLDVDWDGSLMNYHAPQPGTSYWNRMEAGYVSFSTTEYTPLRSVYGTGGWAFR